MQSKETRICIFISHSHADKAIAYELVDFLLEALGLNSKEILCTSDPDQGLSYRPSSITDQLKKRLRNSEALIVLITADSLHSAWIPFEVGSFWTTDKPIIPILGPGLTQNDLPGPLKNFLSIPIGVQDIEDKVNSATNQLAEILNLQQAFTSRRNVKLQEFLDSLKAWQSKRPAVTDLQQENEQLKNQIQKLEKEKLDKDFQTKFEELEGHQKEVLKFIISKYGTESFTEQAIAEHFNKRGDAEYYYRLRTLHLLGFLDHTGKKMGVGQNIFSLSEKYHDSLITVN